MTIIQDGSKFMSLKYTIRKVLKEETDRELPPSMLKFLKMEYPTLVKPNKLIMKRLERRRYISNESIFVVTKFYRDDEYTIWFKEFDDKDTNQFAKWELNEELKKMFERFGEEFFQKFILNYFGLDITDKGIKNYNWVFR